jgi:hypothetical protein
MPTLFPTPQEAAQTRADGGFLQGFVHNLLTHGLGLGSAVYNLGNTAAHIIEGTQGQYGPSPTLAGKISQIFTGRNYDPNQPANTQLDKSDPDYNNPNYIGLGDPVGNSSGTGTNIPVPQSDYLTPGPVYTVTPHGGGGSGFAPGIASMPGINPAIGSYAQGTFGGYGGASNLQWLQAQRTDRKQ